MSFDTAAVTAKGTVDMAGKSGVLTALDARLAGLVFEAAEGKKIAFDNASLTANGTFDLARKGGVLTSLEARLPGLAPLRLAGRYGSGKNASSELRFEGRGLDVPALRAIAAPFIPEGFAGWDLGGTLDLSLSARRPAPSGDDLGFSATISLAGAKFNDPSFTVAGEGLDPVLKIEGAGSASKGLSFNAGLDIGQGESLWKSVYIAWSKHPLKLTAAGRYDPGSGGLDGLAARVLLPEVGSIDITGSAKLGPAPSFDLATETRLSLGPLYSLYTQTGVSEEARMLLEGTLGATLRVRKNGEALSVGGPGQARRYEHGAASDQDVPPRRHGRPAGPLRIRAIRRVNPGRGAAPRGGAPPHRRVPERLPDPEARGHLRCAPASTPWASSPSAWSFTAAGSSSAGRSSASIPRPAPSRGSARSPCATSTSRSSPSSRRSSS